MHRADGRSVRGGAYWCVVVCVVRVVVLVVRLMLVVRCGGKRSMPYRRSGGQCEERVKADGWPFPPGGPGVPPLGQPPVPSQPGRPAGLPPLDS